MRIFTTEITGEDKREGYFRPARPLARRGLSPALRLLDGFPHVSIIRAMDPWVVAVGILWIAGLVFGISVLWTGPAGALWLPTSRWAVRRMLRLAEVQPGEVVYDLGSGDGRVLFIAAREFGARAVGVELDPLRYLWTQVWITLLGLRGQVRVILGNFFTRDVSEADVVVTYLVPKAQYKLMFKLWRELAVGARVVSSIFVYPGWEPQHVDREAHLFLYHVAENHKERMRPSPANGDAAPDGENIREDGTGNR